MLECAYRFIQILQSAKFTRNFSKIFYWLEGSCIEWVVSFKKKGRLNYFSVSFWSGNFSIWRFWWKRLFSVFICSSNIFVHSKHFSKFVSKNLFQILKAPTQEYYLLVRNCWAVPNFESSSKLQLITEGCMDDDLRRQGLDFEVTDNGHSHKVTFTIPVIKFVE